MVGACLTGANLNTQMVDRNNKKLLIIILILAAVARFATVFLFFGEYRPIDDAADWHIAAQNLLAGHGLIFEKGFRAYRTPVPALYFAAIYSIFGVSIRAVQIANVFIGVLTVWLIHDLARRSFGIIPALWAAALVSCHPLLLLYTGQLLSETLVILFIALALWLIWVLRNRPALWFAPVGIVFGLAALTRESMLPVAAFVALWTVIIRAREGWLRRIAPAAVILSFLALTLAPWTIRNYSIFGKFVPLTTKGGLSLWIANNPLADGGVTGNVLAIPEGNTLAEGELGPVHQKMAVQFIEENPLNFVRLALRRLVYFWHLGYHGDGLYEVIFLAMYWPLLGLAITGAGIAWRSNRDATLLILTVPVLLTLIHMVFLPDGRYRLPADLMICVFAGCGMHWVISRVSERPDASLSALRKKIPLASTKQFE
jgi:4-amino-4-deoxy-L-arabinose transferase-like glycosyltransferase